MDLIDLGTTCMWTVWNWHLRMIVTLRSLCRNLLLLKNKTLSASASGKQKEQDKSHWQLYFYVCWQKEEAVKEEGKSV